jgi:hypothetical protein
MSSLLAIGLIEKRSVHGVERNHYDTAGLWAFEREVTELSLHCGWSGNWIAVGVQFFEVSDVYRFAVLEEGELILAQAVQMFARLVRHDDRDLDQDSLRAEFDFGFIIGRTGMDYPEVDVLALSHHGGIARIGRAIDISAGTPGATASGLTLSKTGDEKHGEEKSQAASQHTDSTKTRTDCTPNRAAT